MPTLLLTASSYTQRPSVTSTGNELTDALGTNSRPFTAIIIHNC